MFVLCIPCKNNEVAMLCLWFVYLVKNNEVGAMLAVLNVFFAPKHGDS